MRRACGEDGDDGGVAGCGQVKERSAAANNLVEIYPNIGDLASNYPMHTECAGRGVNNKIGRDKAHGIWTLGTQNTFLKSRRPSLESRR